MWLQVRKKPMPFLTFTRSISVGHKSIKIWVPTSPDTCEGDLDLLADEQAMLAATLSDEDDDCWFLAYKLVQQLSLVSAAEVTDNEGNGAIVHESEELPNQKVQEVYRER